MKDEEFTPEMIDMIAQNKRIVQKKLDYYEHIGEEMDDGDIKSLSQLSGQLKTLSQEERAWEALYGVKTLTDEQLKAEVIPILRKLGIEFTDLEPIKKKKTWYKDPVSGKRIWKES